ncbi:MAG: glycosyltransferase family 2 protein [Deltaproteobacteria bacterium]|nr:glycosyltransferase family 2 protein [Deltaproteobacteria bacterium]
MKISVIMTTYNRPTAMERVLDGLRYQTRLPDEVIIADDGSGAGTAASIERFLKVSPFPLHHVWHADRGFRAAAIRNKAIRRSTGEYIVSLDGDCIPEKHFIEDHLKLARRGSFFQGKRILVDREISKSFTFRDTDTFFKKIKLLLKPGIGNRHHLARMSFFPAVTFNSLSGIRSCNIGFFRDDIFAVNGFNEDFQGWGREDSELAARFFNYGLQRKSHLFMAVCVHLWHAENNRSRLVVNDDLLKKCIDSKAVSCFNGLTQKR